MASRLRKNSRNHNHNARKSSYVFEYRITFLGAERVGKSAIINQFIEKKFLTQHTPTAEDHLTHVVEHRGNMCVCLLVDTAGSDDFPAMRKLSVSKGNAFIVVYSINDRKSYVRAKTFVNEIKELKENSAEVKIVLVGNKADLEDSREVPYAEALSYAGSLHEGNVITAFVESSAKDYESVTEIVQELLNMFIPPPPQIEVPVLNEKRRLSIPKLMIRPSRRASKSSEIKEDECSVDSDSELSVLRSISPVSSEPMFPKRFRSRSDSTPALITIPSRLLDSPPPPVPEPSTPKHNRRSSRRTSSPLHIRSIQEIGDPVLISHSLSLNRYALPLRKTLSNSDSDSGVSEDSNSPEMPPKFKLGRRASLPAQNSLSPFGNGGRRASISEKMRGIFRKKSTELM